MYTDILIIGAGVTGTALARVLSRYEASVTIIDRAPDAAEGASKANSGIVHAGYDAEPGSLKAKLNVQGAAMYAAVCEELGVPYSQPGALVVAFSESDRPTIEKLYNQGIANGVPGVRIIEHDEIMAMEPNTNPACVCALDVPTSGLVSPYELTFAQADHAAVNGTKFIFNQEVISIAKGEDGLWHVKTADAEYTCKTVVNAAGAGSAELHNMLCDEKIQIIHRRGQYYLLDHPAVAPFSRTMFQCPTRMGKGVLVSPTVHGNVLLGPSAEDIEDGLDTRTTADVLAGVLATCRLTWPGVNTRGAITNFSGIRAHEAKGDFVIGAIPGVEGAYDAAGIESPGLSSAPAIGEMLGTQIADDMGLVKKDTIVPAPKRMKPFCSMTSEERAQAIAENPLNGRIICRCEVVTEAEIREAIRRPVGATTIDGVKRRTRAGMGRCQGGFCSPRVTEILAEELGIPMTEVTKMGGESKLLFGGIREAMKEANKA